MNFDFSCVTQRSMPFWCVGNPLSDPFGSKVLPPIDSVEVAELLAQSADAGLIEATGFHDDDLVEWDPAHPEDDLDPASPCSRKLRKIKAILDAAHLEVNTATCSLHGNILFRDGGLCNPDPAIRALAAKKVERTLRIGAMFGAKYYTYWVARDGFEVPGAVDWKNVYDHLAAGLNHVTDYIGEKHLDNYLGATIEPKPNEPRGQMFIPTSGHAAGFIAAKLRRPEFWGVNPELLQHESMCLLNAVMTVGYLCSVGKLKFLHFGSQIKAQFDNDFPPLIGPEGLKETVMMFHALKEIGWRGVVEFDCHMLRSEGDPARATECRMEFIRNCVSALSMALQLAERITTPQFPVTKLSRADLQNTMELCALDELKITRTN